MNKNQHKEEQRFRRWEVFALLLLLLMAVSYHFIELYISGVYGLNVLTPQYALIALVLTGGLAYFWSIRLILNVDKEGIQYQFFPLHYRKHKIKWEDVESVEFVDTHLSAELSGWAVRLGTWERMFSVSGRTGLSLNLKNEQQLFIGTQHPDELKLTLDYLNII